MPPAATAVFRGSRAELRKTLTTLPAILAGRHPDPLGVARGLQLRVSLATLSAVQSDFIIKSRGGTGRDGVRWAPLSKRTLTKKRTGGTGKADQLRNSGRLLRSLTPGVDGSATGPDQVVQTLPGSVVVGTNLGYAGYLQNGTRRMPARPFLPVGGRIPAAYWPGIMLAAARGVSRAVVLVLGGRV